MPPKRHLGLGKAALAKKHRPNEPSSAEEPSSKSTPQEQELTVELGEEVGANDAMAQLRALWRNFIESKDRNELKLNGIIHECDRILRKVHNRTEKAGDNAGKPNPAAADTKPASAEGVSDESDEEVIELTGDFYAIYGLALSSLAFFYTEEPKKVKEFFSEAKSRIRVGKEQFSDSLSLLFAEARVLMNEIPLKEIRPLTVDSKVDSKTRDVAQILDSCLAVWEQAESLSKQRKEYRYFNLENSDFLQALDDLLDMVDNFGKDLTEGKDSDAEDGEDDDAPELGPKHPLYAIASSDKYDLWWREHTQKFLDNLNERIRVENIPESSHQHQSILLRRELCKRLGQSLLSEAETPLNVFTMLTYYNKEAKELGGLTREEARKISQELLGNALKYLRWAQDDEEPDSWAAVAEALISLGNTHDLDSEEQENIYKEAEDILTRANNATNGRYETILENFTQN